MIETSITVIETERLRLRTWREDDLVRFSEINADPDVMHFFPAPLTTDETALMITRLQEHQQEHGFCFWAVDLIESNHLIGMLGLSRPKMKTSFTPCVEIGWRLHPAFWGKGLATEGALACLHYGWEVLELEEIVSFTACINLPSQRVMEKIGMRRDGVFDHPALPDGHELQPHVLYRISRPSSPDPV